MAARLGTAAFDIVRTIPAGAWTRAAAAQARHGRGGTAGSPTPAARGLMAEQLFDGDAARLLLLGNAMHADVPIDAPGSGVMGYLLIMMAQDGGFPCRWAARAS